MGKAGFYMGSVAGLTRALSRLPIAHGVFEGNMVETGTLAPISRRLPSLDNVATPEKPDRAQGAIPTAPACDPGRIPWARRRLSLSSGQGGFDRGLIT